MSRGHVTQRPSGKWAAVVYLGRDEAGKDRHKWYTLETKKEAEKKLTEVLGQIDGGGYVEPSNERTGDFLKRWLAIVRPSVSERTAEGYEHILVRHIIPSLGPIPLTKLTPQRIQAYYSEKLASGRLVRASKGTPQPQPSGLSARTVRHHHVTLHDALQAAVKWGLIARNPTDAVDAPKFQRPEMHTLSADNLNDFLGAAQDTQWRPVFYLALFTGLRRSELLALRWSDVDLTLGQLYVNRSLHRLRDGRIVFNNPKTAKSRRMVALGPSASMMLRAHREAGDRLREELGSPTQREEDLIFAHVDGTPIPPDSLTQAWRKLAKRSGFGNIRLHDARHTHASLMLTQGVHPKIVQERLGHATIATTLDIYSHVAPGMQEAAAAGFDTVIRHAAPARVEASVS